MAESRIIWAAPIHRMVEALRSEADTLREIGRDEQRAQLLEGTAQRLESAVEEAAAGEWILTDDAAPLLQITEDGVRARCRRSYAARGLARKRGGRWYVHVDVLPTADPEGAAA